MISRALLCLLGLAPAIAIKLAGLAAFWAPAPVPGPASPEPAFVVNQAAKSDRLPLFSAASMSMTNAEPFPAPASAPAPAPPLSAGEATTPADRHWRNANASITPALSPPRHAERKDNRPSAEKVPPAARAEA